MLISITWILVLAGVGASISGYIQQRKEIELSKNRRMNKKKEFEEFFSSVERNSVRVR